MAEERNRTVTKVVKDSGSSNLVYCLGLIGAAIYYIQQADGFWDGVVGVLKALVWPAFLVHRLLQFLEI